MFTGIVEALGHIIDLQTDRSNCRFTLECPFVSELKVDQSLAHDGVCLTVESVQMPGSQSDKGSYTVTAVEETLMRSHLGNRKIGQRVNLERSLKADSRIDGHFVQGHVDDVGTLLSVSDRQGSWQLTFNFESKYAHLIVPKGSIAVNGVSLTVADLGEKTFSVAVIPYTWEHTNLSDLLPGDPVNLEFDLMGKYIARFWERRNE